MPFQPIIGSNFDALGQQQLAWAGMNNQVDSANIARANQAQEVQNRWMQQVAAARDSAQQRDLELQQQADQVARQSALTASAAAEDRRRFDVGTEMDKERLKAENARTKEMGKVSDTNLALQQHAKDQQIESSGQTAANSYLISKNTSDAANRAYERVQSEIDQAASDQQAELDKPAKQRDPAKLAAIATKSKALAASLRQATLDRQRAENNFQSIGNKIQNEGFQLDLENDQVVHPATGKKWSFKAALDKAKSAITEPGFEETTPGSGWMRPVLPAAGADTPPPTWAGFGQGSNASTSPTAPVISPVAPPTASTNSLRIGRFTVTPQ